MYWFSFFFLINRSDILHCLCAIFNGKNACERNFHKNLTHTHTISNYVKWTLLILYKLAGIVVFLQIFFFLELCFIYHINQWHTTEPLERFQFWDWFFFVDCLKTLAFVWDHSFKASEQVYLEQFLIISRLDYNATLWGLQQHS